MEQRVAQHGEPVSFASGTHHPVGDCFAALAATAGLDPRLSPFVAGYVLALGAPVLVANSRALARFVPARLVSGRGAA